MHDVYDPSYLNFSYLDLLKLCFEVNLNLNDSKLDAIKADTRKQSKKWPHQSFSQLGSGTQYSNAAITIFDQVSLLPSPVQCYLKSYHTWQDI